ncbi:HxlR family transcriptional regulator [Halorubrum distributum JCM 9100]|uniref:HxlR family transcriptional regulator n=2 Tax=Halorubrum distributum TaxID=29283 RepID=M0EUA8_9EURY|nr:helix-turn-helix domain-containing protein [Halorubrum distributum]ELZ51381.1 HxlR family transcriptional regulator [Halorubrum distributum JCM 9100]ELZ53131.1 HxlR family transcriptional regulator [Halorubrum distributum JCM 10118]
MSSQDLSAAESAETADSGADATADSGADAAPEATAPDTPCPVIDSIEQIGSQWRLVVLHELLNGEARFNELKRETDANARTLSRVLDDLQETGFVDRRLEEDSPVATYYSLTDKGESLAPVFEEIDEWAHEWLAECDA